MYIYLTFYIILISHLANAQFFFPLLRWRNAKLQLGASLCKADRRARFSEGSWTGVSFRICKLT